MAQKKSYSRYFIILQEDEKGYSLASDKIASGYAKLETKNDKCRISYYVQNLKKEKTPYYMMLICNKKGIKNIIKIGEMNIDDYGRADTCYEYPIVDVASSGISMDKVSGAAIARILDNNIISVMSGFSSTEIPDWRSFELVGDGNYQVQEEVNEEEVKVRQKDVIEKEEHREKSIFDKYEESIEKAKMDREKAESENKTEEEDKQVLNEMEDEEDKDVFMDKGEENISEDISDSEVRETIKDKNIILEDDLKDKDTVYVDDFTEEHCEKSQCNNCEGKDNLINRNYQTRSSGNFFKELVHGFKEVKNLNKELKRCKWYKVPANSIEDMYNMDDYNRYVLVYYPMIGYYPYIKKHLHYLTGYKFDKNNKVKYLIYAIPGTNSKKDQPYGGKSGFVTWIPKEGKDSMGYWLMFYDFKTNTIAIPVKK